MFSLSDFALVPIGVIVVISAINKLLRWRQDRAFADSHGCKPPAKLSRIENIKEVLHANRKHAWLDMWYRRYSRVAPTFESATVSINPIIFTNEPENIKTILATDFNAFDLGHRRKELMDPIVGPGIFSSDGQAWRHSRALIRPTLSKAQISNLPCFERHFQNLLTALPPVDKLSNQVEVNLQPLFLRMTLDSASETLLGRSLSFRSLLDPPGSKSLRFLDAFDYATKVVHMRHALNRGYTKPYSIASRLWQNWKGDKFEESCKTVHTVMDDVVSEYLRSHYQKPFEKKDANGNKEGADESGSETQKHVLIDAMAESTLDPSELRFEVLNVLIAGRDTTGALLSNVFFMLARHPDVWDRVRAEVEETFEGRLPDFESLHNLKQIRYLLNESLRLFPPLPLNMRTANTNTTLPKGGGPEGKDPVFVKEGQQVNYHVYALHRSKETFGPDAEDYRPDRWENPELRPGWGYIPFNGGARVCLGQQLALTQATYVVVRMMQEFTSITRRDKQEEWQEQITLNTKSLHGTKVALMKADKKA